MPNACQDAGPTPIQGGIRELSRVKDPALMLSLAAVLLAAAATSPIIPPSSSETKQNVPPGDPSIHREVADDEPRAYEPRTDLPLAPPIAPGSPNAGVQVNVNAFGANIPGDAANEPSIAVDPAAPSRIVIGWRQFDNVQSNFRQAGVAYSHDAGATWTFPGVIEPGVFRSDPVLDVDADGTFYYCSLRGDFACTMFRSVDGGQTWDNGTFAYGGDKQWFSIDRSGTATRDNQYLFWNPSFSFAGGAFTRSVNAGQTFLNPINLPGTLFWGSTSVAPDGTLFLGGINGTFTPRVHRMLPSTSPITPPIFDLNSSVSLGGNLRSGDGPNPGGLLGQLWIAADQSARANSTNIYMLASVDPTGSDPLDVMFARSTDRGNTWETPVRLNDDPPGANNWQWFGTMSVAPNGRIDAIWYDTRDDPGGFRSAVYFTSSFDAGLTWTPNEQVTPDFDPFLGYPNQNKIGDYVHMISDNLGAHLAYAATFNGEQDVYYKRLGELDCNNNGIPDVDDLADGTVDDVNGNQIPDCCEPDCNNNGVLDEFEILNGTTADCNTNGVPDSCEPDCNMNGVPDVCDLASETSDDVNGNFLPDECEPPLNETCMQSFLVAVNTPFTFRTESAMDDGFDESCGAFGRDVWYRVIAPTAGRLSISAVTADFDARLAFYDFNCPNAPDTALVCVDAAAIAPPVSIEGGAPMLVRLRIGGVDDAEGTGELTIDFRRFNNGCPADCAPFDQARNAGNGIVNIDDLLAVINAFGTTDPLVDVAPENEDLTVGNGAVNIDDLLHVINSFGACP
jgi:hypothetical protein